jgi:hypothetical protein
MVVIDPGKSYNYIARDKEARACGGLENGNGGQVAFSMGLSFP